MAVVVGRMLVTLEAQTAAFSARMAAAGQQINRFGGTAMSARRGVSQMQFGLQALAFQAAGIPGPVGRAVSAIGMLGAGSFTTLAVVAGIGAIALAYKLAAKEANDLIVSTERLNTSYRDIVAGGRPLVLLQNRIQTALQQQTEAQAKLDRLRQTVGMGKTRGSPGEIALAETNVEAATRVVIALRQLRPEMVAAAQLVTITFQQGAAQLARGGVFQALRARLEAPAFGAAGLGLGGTPLSFANIRGNVPRFVPDPLAPEQFPPREFFISDLVKEGGKTRQPGFKMTPEFAIMSSMALLQGAQGGGVGGFLGAAAGPVSMINPLAGAITAGVGGIFSLFDRSEERRHRELVDKLERIANEVGLERVTVVFTGPDGHQVRKSLAELESGDAVERVPGPVGATG